jgi:UDP-N-acetylglucosamine--N-acetylmuramyl-(pentapeptide) pyrophosphoryl-undecaprenol N-acetylglucosamine transferase
MGAAYAAADLVLSRSGASCLGEYPFFGLPAILVPYPHAWRYQKVNAKYLVDRGAALILPDEELMLKLHDTIRDLFSSPEKMNEMRASMQSLSHTGAADQIADQLLEMAGSRR